MSSEPVSETAGAEVPAPAGDRRKVIAALEAELARTPRGLRPYEHAALAYRLGLAYAESPVGNPTDGLRRALACYEVAAGIFDPQLDPAEHARVLNAAGAAHRALGDPGRAVKLFQQAASLLEGRSRDAERAAALNNLGLAGVELGQPAQAVAACDAALDLFETDTAEGRRGRVATLHTRGMAKAALGTREGLEGALADYQEAADEVDVEEAPYHHALVHHSVGVTCTALAGAEGTAEPTVRHRLLNEAAAAFTRSLSVFSRADFPHQHAVAKHNLGLALVALGDRNDLRRALACFEDAAAVFDPRMQAGAWQQAYASLMRVEAQLAEQYPDTSRTQHFAALVVESDEREAMALLRDRIGRLLTLPEGIAKGAFADLALASVGLGYEGARTVISRMLDVLMELPNESLATVLGATFESYSRLPPEERVEANRALDQAVSDALVGPQRIWVRDFLYSLGFERP